jgi:hypothetical protein
MQTERRRTTTTTTTMTASVDDERFSPRVCLFLETMRQRQAIEDAQEARAEQKKARTSVPKRE